jgi:hypothetical protein
MISKDKTYRTRDGREVRIYATDAGDKYPIHGAIRWPNFWSPGNWTETGKYRASYSDHDYDLIEVKPRIKRTVWLNVYEHLISASETPIQQFLQKPLARVKVEIDCEEGEGL